jgi:hypothetical protein
MFETGVYHVSELGRIRSASLQRRLSAEQYGQALDHLVITCADLVSTHQETILLAQRNKHPRNGLHSVNLTYQIALTWIIHEGEKRGKKESLKRIESGFPDNLLPPSCHDSL